MSFGSFFKHYIAPAISGILLITGIRWADTTFMVPVTVFTVQKIDVEPDAVFLSGRMYKPAYRASCSFEELIATVDELPPIRIFKRIDGDAFTRPPGWTTFERWRIPGRDVSLITLTARHSCYGSMLWDHSTHLSDIQIQKVRIQ